MRASLVLVLAALSHQADWRDQRLRDLHDVRFARPGEWFNIENLTRRQKALLADYHTRSGTRIINGRSQDVLPDIAFSPKSTSPRHSAL